MVTTLSSPRCLGALVAMKGFLYAVGGYDGASVLQSFQVRCLVLSGETSGFLSPVSGATWLVMSSSDYRVLPRPVQSNTTTLLASAI